MNVIREDLGFEPTAHTYEEACAVWYRDAQRAAGYHSEFGGMLNREFTDWTYYALVIPKNDYEAYKEEVDERDRKEWARARSIGYVEGEMEDRKDLPWEDMVLHPFFEGGYDTPLEALIASEMRAIEGAAPQPQTLEQTLEQIDFDIIELPMTREGVNRLSDNQQWALYITGARSLLMRARQEGFLTIDSGALWLILDEIEDTLVFGRTGLSALQKEDVIHTTRNLSQLAGSAVIDRFLEGDVVHVEFEQEAKTPEFTTFRGPIEMTVEQLRSIAV